MNAERLQQLAEAYGADLRRWPEGEREAGRALLAAEPHLAARLETEADLDHLLWASPQPAVSMQLRDQILAAAPTVRRAHQWQRMLRDRLTLAFGAGWAVAACAGVVAGVMVSAQISADASADAVLYQASQSSLDNSEWVG